MSENRLGRETSPYLIQHKDNPVHWWPWGPEALAEAERAQKPILLSVGYAACHWCHVMAHESFEDAETAAVMNELFVNIKVDREERPDIDAIYMSALHRLGQQGGWPLTMFLDASGRPFWGGTYFPKEAQFGRPAFTAVLKEIARIYRDEPEKVTNNADALVSSLMAKEPPPGAGEITDDMLSELTRRMTNVVDEQRGGINGAPKFPQWSFFWLLWRGGIRYADQEAQSAVLTTLTNICQGGIYDHLRGGFARYSVDERWLVPHFEKMLYDNALLVDLLTEAWRETANPLLKARIAETVAWLEAEMIADGGGFAASLDADSEGEEGKFYVWSEAEIEDVLGQQDAKFFSQIYDVSGGGNWAGHSILNRLGAMDLGDEADELRLAALREKLLARRASRVRPSWDDKVLTDWNGLMIAALARASQVFQQPDWLALAQRAFGFVQENMTVDGRLRHAYRERLGTAPATASDYANMIWGALRLYQATSDGAYLDQAKAWTDVLDRHYWEEDDGGYATSADDTVDVIARLRSAQDDATPNANGVMVSNLAALSLLTGDVRYADKARDVLRAFAGDWMRNLVAHVGLLASSLDVAAPQAVVVAGSNLPGGAGLVKAVHGLSLPGAIEVLAKSGDDAAPASGIVEGKQPMAGRAAAYACLGPRCSAPLQRADELANLLKIQRLVE